MFSGDSDFFFFFKKLYKQFAQKIKQKNYYQYDMIYNREA